MSDSEVSTVTYTELSSPYEDLSDVGSPGVEGPIFQDPPSPDYVPGPEEPEQAPPSPIYIPFVPEPDLLEFLPWDDEGFPCKEQPMPAADSPTHQSPGYIPESDPEEDPEEDDEEDPEEDPADYPADRGDRDDEESSDDDDDAEEEHLAPATPVALLIQLTRTPTLAYRRPRLLLLVPYEDGGEFGTDVLAGLDLPQQRPIISSTWHGSDDSCDQVHSEGISLWTTVMAQQSEITELQAADLKEPQDSDDRSFRDSRPAKDPAEPELPEEASSSS
ncbi:hypothetical protein Tco_0990152 [Tanacetum coccineum]|uniref:Uncharacterized protein n=1 Tax=Tanacetum coccineum TaxID=301880 RepID=A0ABQ5EWG0_9ASTR